VVDGGISSTGIGANSTVNFGTNTGGTSEPVAITGDLTEAATSGGTSTTGIAMITLGNVVHAAGDQIVFNNAATEVLASPNAVNIISAASLPQALDIAAASAAATQSGGTIAALPICRQHLSRRDDQQYRISGKPPCPRRHR
jgi:hypothetical protein